MSEILATQTIDLVGPTTQTLRRRRIFGHKGLMTGTTLLTIAVLMALLAPLLAPHDPYAQELTRRLIPPIWHDKAPGRISSAPTIWVATTSRA